MQGPPSGKPGLPRQVPPAVLVLPLPCAELGLICSLGHLAFWATWPPVAVLDLAPDAGQQGCTVQGDGEPSASSVEDYTGLCNSAAVLGSYTAGSRRASL